MKRASAKRKDPFQCQGDGKEHFACNSKKKKTEKDERALNVTIQHLLLFDIGCMTAQREGCRPLLMFFSQGQRAAHSLLDCPTGRDFHNATVHRDDLFRRRTPMKLFFRRHFDRFLAESHNARKPHVQCRFFLPAGEHFFLSCAVSHHMNLAGLFFFCSFCDGHFQERPKTKLNCGSKVSIPAPLHLPTVEVHDAVY